MEKSTIIKLRQIESTDVAQNGAYNVSLKEGVTLEEGDVVKLHTVILDTSTESFITLQDDTEIEMDVCNYLRNYKFNNPINQHFQIVINDSQPDLNMYFPCLETGVSGNEYLVESIDCWGAGGRRTDPIEIEYSYTSPADGQVVTESVFVPSFRGLDHLNGFRTPVNKLISGKEIKILNTKQDFKNHHIAVGGGLQPFPYFIINPTPLPNPSGNEVHNSLFTRTLKFTIPAGRYYPSEMATIINDEMSKLDSLGTVGYDVATNKYPVESAFMNTLHQLNHLVTDPVVQGGLGKDINYNPTIPTDNDIPSQILSYNTGALLSTTDPVIGANEISLNYDDNLKKLNFDALHMPFYVGATAPAQGGQPGLVYPALPPTYLVPNTGINEPIPHVPQPSYGGAFFTRLSPINFWSRQLGFENLVVNPQTSVQLLTGRTSFTAAALPDLYPISLKLTPGVNIVTSFEGLDNIIPKNNLAYVPVLGEVSQPLTTPIISQREFDTPNNDEGFYLVEVGMALPQKMIGGEGSNTTSNKVQGIIGKFFTAGNFLQSQGQGAIVYEHQGEPVLLNDLSVAIRNPDMSLPVSNDIGDKNSVFLEVIKQVQPKPSN